MDRPTFTAGRPVVVAKASLVAGEILGQV